MENQYTSRFAVIKMIVNRFCIAADLKMMGVSFSVKQRYYLDNGLMEDRTTSIYVAL